MDGSDGARRELDIGNEISLRDAYDIARGNASVTLGPDAQERCSQSAATLQTLISERRHIYGITTGFGPLADRLLDPQDIELLQQNLVHHLASGVGPSYSFVEARAIVLARLRSISQGHSAASHPTLNLLIKLLNSRLAPVIPQRGTVGASGDLTPLAHMVLCLQGRGEFMRRTGERVSPEDAFKELESAPLTLENRDGLALVNGTSAMTAVAAVNAYRAECLVDWSIALTAALGDVMKARLEAWDEIFSIVRPHPGQIHASRELRRRTLGSQRFVDTPLFRNKVPDDAIGKAELIGQDAYTLRCAPQVIGAVADCLTWHNSTTQIEFNAVTDNPIFDSESVNSVFHGGNFMGQNIAIVSDAMANSIVVLAGLAERQIARICDERLSGGFPPFLHGSTAGLNSGLMGAQVTATALVSELRSIGPASINSISTNAANQDVVSLGTIAARQLRDKIDLTAQVLAILSISVARACDIITDTNAAEVNDSTKRIYEFVRRFSLRLDMDRPLGEEIEILASQVAQQPPPP